VAGGKGSEIIVEREGLKFEWSNLFKKFWAGATDNILDQTAGKTSSSNRNKHKARKLDQVTRGNKHAQGKLPCPEEIEPDDGGAERYQNPARLAEVSETFEKAPRFRIEGTYRLQNQRIDHQKNGEHNRPGDCRLLDTG